MTRLLRPTIAFLLHGRAMYYTVGAQPATLLKRLGYKQLDIEQHIRKIKVNSIAAIHTPSRDDEDKTTTSYQVRFDNGTYMVFEDIDGIPIFTDR